VKRLKISRDEESEANFFQIKLPFWNWITDHHGLLNSKQIWRLYRAYSTVWVKNKSPCGWFSDNFFQIVGNF